MESFLATILTASTASLVLRILFTASAIYYASFGYCFLRNLYNSRKTGLPSIHVPWDQNAVAWMVVSVPLRPLMKRNLPTWIYNRLSLTIYCWEYLERLRPYRELESRGQHPDTFQLVTCGRFEVWTRDPEVASEILRRPDEFRVFEFTKLFMGKFGRNVLSVDNPLWQRHRKVVASVINERISKSVFHESLKQTDGMLQELLENRETPAGYAVTAKAFDNLKKITIHVLSGAGMGVSPDWKNDKAERPKPGFKLTYIDAVKVIIGAMAGPIIFPEWLLLNWPAILPGAKYLHGVGVGVHEFPIHTKGLLDAERERVNGDQVQRANIMSHLIAASEQAEGKMISSNVKNRALSEDEMVGNLFVFTAAGFDTTANSLAFALTILARYPQWQDWLMEEIDSIVPVSADFNDWDYAEIFPKAIRTMAFMFETLRLWPPLIHLAKTTHTAQRLTVSHGTYWIPKNTTVYINTVALHLKPEIWRDLNMPAEGDRVPDAGSSPFLVNQDDGDETRFRPTRWITTGTGALYQPPRGTYLPWSSGPRVCPGQKMAQVEFTTIFLRLLSVCRVEAEPLVMDTDGIKKEETRDQINNRLDEQIRDSISLLTLQMNGVYDINEAKGEGLKLRFVRRSHAT